MQYVLIKMIKNLGIAFFGKKMLLALAKIYVKYTKPEWDDVALKLIESLVDGDIPSVQKYGVELAEIAMKEMKKDEPIK